MFWKLKIGQLTNYILKKLHISFKKKFVTHRDWKFTCPVLISETVFGSKKGNSEQKCYQSFIFGNSFTKRHEV